MRLSRTITYAIRATLHLAASSPGVPVPCKQLACAGQMPERFLLQILRCLVTNGVLVSTRGAEGGFCLSRDASQITIRHILDAFDNSLDPAVPQLNGFAEPTQMKLFATLQRASQKARQELQQLTVAELLSCERAAKNAIVFDRMPTQQSNVDIPMR